jgi:chemotaxis protein MotB
LNPPEPDNAPPPPPAPRLRSRPCPRHGGAWKVAYADFVTAMMALFIVLWMMSSTQRVKASITGYFRDPRGYTEKRGAGPASSGEGLPVDRHNIADIRKQIEEALHRMPEFHELGDHIKLSVTGEGLRIDLLENEQGLFFVTGSPNPTVEG